MAGLVEQLQSDALDPQVPVDTLLRKVKVSAVKLGLDDALNWVEAELTGYRNVETEDIPEYRKGHGQTVAFNPYHGWQAIEFGHAELADIVSSVLLLEPIGNYEKLVSTGEQSLYLPLPNHLVVKLNEMLNVSTPRISNSISPGVIVQILQRVRDMVLDWALELSRAGITGEGMSFTQNEREKAAASSISIGTFNGSFSNGDASGENSTINISSSLDIASDLFEKLETTLKLEIADELERAKILDATTQLANASDKSDVLEAYNSFLEKAANHMTIIAPFLPALGKYIALA